MSFIGNDEIAQVFIGDAEVYKIYIGQDLVYEKGATPQEYFVTFSSTAPFTMATSDQLSHWDGTIEYSADKSTWTTWDGTTTLSSGSNDELYLRGTGNSTLSQNRSLGSIFVFTGSNISIKGDIENLLDYATVKLGNHPTILDGAFNYLFSACTQILDCSQFVLSCPVLSTNCYAGMFLQCSSLTNPPIISATTMATNACDRMFTACTSLLTAPALPATTLANGCYAGMFANCTSITGVIDLTHIQSLINVFSHGLSAYFSTNFYPAIRFGTNLTSIAENSFKPLYSGGSISVYYEFTDNDTPQFTLANVVSKGTGSKDAMAYKIYTNNTAIRNAAIAQTDEYTTVNVYKLDGGSW